MTIKERLDVLTGLELTEWKFFVSQAVTRVGKKPFSEEGDPEIKMIHELGLLHVEMMFDTK